MMELDTKDKEILLSWGYETSDFAQISEAMKASNTRYTLYDHGHSQGKCITREEAVELLGRMTYLSGLSRSAFHFGAARTTPCGQIILFDSSKMFNRGGGK